MHLEYEIGKKFNNKKRWLLLSVAFFFILATSLAGTYFYFEKKYEKKIYPGVYLGQENLGGKTFAEAEKIIREKITKIEIEGIKFNYKNHTRFLNPTVSSLNGDLAYQIMTFKPMETASLAMVIGREGNFWQRQLIKFKALKDKKKINLIHNLNSEESKKILEITYQKLEIPAEDATLNFEEKGKLINFKVKKEKQGLAIDFDEGIKKLKENISNLNFEEIELKSYSDYPEIYKNECLNILPKAQKMLEKSPLTLTATSSKYYYGRKKIEEKKWNITKEIFASWFILKKDHSTTSEKEKIIVDLDIKKIEKYIEKNFSKDINIEPEPAKFEMKNGKVSKFQQNKTGWLLNPEINSLKLITDFKNGSSTISLIVEEIKSPVSIDEVNDYGLKEIIGTGRSNFAGSPANRKHNIKTGSNSVDGLLIAPNEEFSLVKALGKINKDTGYLPELVIKGNQTIPEYGGGLCQVATTLFRAALKSGLNITARRNHSYRVSYYEPAGTDAAVYEPWPDVRFINDTEKHILIQVRFDGNDLYFNFWGTNDGRTVETTDPTIYNITKPGPTKIVETLDLAVGEKKCTEHAHNGADAYFDHKIIYISKEIKEKRYSSHYVPWQEVCLIGVEKLSTEENSTATSTEESAN